MTEASRFQATYLAAAAVLLGLALALSFPIYFRTDDTVYLEWAAQHGNPLAAFHAREAGVFATYRPLNLLTWWLLYRLFGLHPLPYHLTLLGLLLLSFIVYFKLIELAYSSRAAWLSLAAYATVFFYLAQVGFWISDLVLGLELLFINLSLYCLLRRWHNGLSPLYAFLALLLAMLAKEPSAVLVPAVAATFAWSHWPSWSPAVRQSSRREIGALTTLGLLWMLVNPHYWNRQQSLLSWDGGLGNFLWERWSFYAHQLLTGSGSLIWLLMAYWVWREMILRPRGDLRRDFYLGLAICSVSAFAVVPFPELALVGVFLAGLLLIIRRAPVAFAAVWFLLPVAGFLTVPLRVRTYLAEGALGASALMGAALDDIWLRTRPDWTHWTARSRKAVLLVALAALIAGGFLLRPRLQERWQALSVVSASRQNFGDAVDFVCQNLNRSGIRLIAIDYEDMGLKHAEDILRLPDLEKAHRQKTMSSADLQRLLRADSHRDAQPDLAS
jgi:hypothetical protein